MRDYRVPTIAALSIVFLFGLGATLLITREIAQIDWAYLERAEAISF